MTKKATMPAQFLIVGVVALFPGVVSLVALPCPTCDGLGSLSSPAGLKAGLISSTQIESYVPLTCCDHPEVQYTYSISLSVENMGAKFVAGKVMVVFYDIEPALSSSNKVNPVAEDIFSIPVEVPAGKTIAVDEELSFISFSDILNQPHNLVVRSGDAAAESLCPQCNGTGNLGFYHWLEARVG
jgi:hypothetical protein